MMFTQVRNLQQDIYRNIVKFTPNNVAFADLFNDSDRAAQVAGIAIANVQPSDSLQFHYKTAINYPFEADKFMASRFSDGTFPIWYGSLQVTTTIAETVHHLIKTEMNIRNIENYSVIKRHRRIYEVFCNAFLIDATSHALVDDYVQTQKLGKQLQQQGYPGLLSMSLHEKSGVNANIFKKDILSNPRPVQEMTYLLFPLLKKVEVQQNSQELKDFYFE